MRNALLSILLFTVFQAVAQYTPPVDFKIYLAGNFGEIRSDHFHSGIDIKTEGAVGKAVYSIADGYVSRISISPTGYGKALYITHNDGSMSVYAHLEKFADTIDEYVKEEQYRKKSYAVELYPVKYKFPIKQRELVARSGNSGSSAGPHLHFEIRERWGRPVNIMAKRYLTGIADTIPPRFLTLYHVEIDTVRGIPVHTTAGTYALKKIGGTYYISDGKKITTAKPSYFAVEVTDSKNGVQNTMGLYSLTQKIDGMQNFGFSIDDVDFANTRYINTFIAYDLAADAKYEVLRNYVSPNNALSVYNGVIDCGVITLSDTLCRKVEIVITDDNGNSSSLNFDIAGSAAEQPAIEIPGMPVVWNKDFSCEAEGVKVRIPAKALYESILFTLETEDRPANGFSRIYKIHNERTPLKSAITVEITPDSVPPKYADKLTLASLSPKGERVYEGGRFANGKISVETRTFGTYFVAIDTIPPKIEAMFKSGANLGADNFMSVKLSDDFSGIAKWDVYIDDKWALCEYDPKSKTIKHFFKDRRYEKGMQHTFRIDTEDRKGNKSSLIRKFIY